MIASVITGVLPVSYQAWIVSPGTPDCCGDSWQQVVYSVPTKSTPALASTGAKTDTFPEEKS